ncbi:hypothetical protein [Streptomyces vietnamensis]|uniref:hypothetical protein n=1 Tax=Streptomyces vietnamensis TaxID=362257 RepID=UPI0034182611
MRAFRVDVPRLAAVSCVVHNRPAPVEPTPAEPTPTPTEPTPTPTGPTSTPVPPTGPGVYGDDGGYGGQGGHGDEPAQAGDARGLWSALTTLLLSAAGAVPTMVGWRRRQGRTARRLV